MQRVQRSIRVGNNSHREKIEEKARDCKQKLRCLNANARLGSGSEARRKPPVTAAAVKAGFFAFEDLGPLDFSSDDLSEGRLQGCKIAGSSFANANLHGICLYKSDARGVNFDGADLTEASMSEADLRPQGLRGKPEACSGAGPLFRFALRQSLAIG